MDINFANNNGLNAKKLSSEIKLLMINWKLNKKKWTFRNKFYIVRATSGCGPAW